MELNIRELISGSPSRLRYVWRFSTSRVQHPESVAEHSYYVCLYALLIGERCISSATCDKMIDLQNLLRRAIVHDLEEAKSGDFPRLFKNSKPELKKLLDAVSLTAFSQLMHDVVDHTTAMKYNRIWEDAKDETPEGRILEFADFLCVLGFFNHEHEGGNRTVHNHIQDMQGYFHIFHDKRFDFIRPLVDQSSLLMQEIFND